MKTGIGTRVKDARVQLSDGSETTLAALAGKKGLVLYFYPKDSTPGCTTEACDFRDSEALLKRKGFAVVGVSPDSVASHQRFAERQALRFPLIADTELTLCKAFDVWGEKKLYGKTSMGVIRSTFVLEPSLIIRRVYSPVKVDGHVAQILDDIESEQGEATPGRQTGERR